VTGTTLNPVVVTDPRDERCPGEAGSGSNRRPLMRGNRR
jgi:hypothetical protein